MPTTQTRVDLRTVPRRDLRYVLFRIKGGTEGTLVDEKPEFAELVEPLRELMSAHGKSIGGFTDKWDLGIDERLDLDDPRTLFLRQDKWWVLGIRRDVIVDAQPGTIERIVDAGFGSKTDRGYVFSRNDCRKILELVETRKAW